MARREIVVTSPFGRDKGKEFILKEMDAFTCEEWGREALSAVYRCATSSDQGILNFISEGIREAFTKPVAEQVAAPSDGSLPANHPVLLQAQQDAQDEADAQKEQALNAAPTQMAAILGLRLFLQLPYREQRTALMPLLRCVSFEVMGRGFPVARETGAGHEITEQARGYIEEPQTIAFLQAEAFKLHTDFFTPAVRSICDRMMLAATRFNGPKSETSPGA